MAQCPITFEGVEVRLPRMDGVHFRLEGGALHVECTNFTGSFELRPGGGGSGGAEGGPEPWEVPEWLGPARAGAAGAPPSQLLITGISQHAGASCEEGSVTDFVGVESRSLSPSAFASQTQPEVPATQPDPVEEQPPAVVAGGGGRKRPRAQAPVAPVDLEAETQVVEVEEEDEEEDAAGPGAAQPSAMVPELPCTGPSQSQEELKPSQGFDLHGPPATQASWLQAQPAAEAVLPSQGPAVGGALTQSDVGGEEPAPEEARLSLHDLVRARWSACRVTGDTAAPSARWGHGATLLGDGRALVYGGQNAADQTLGDVHVFDGGRGEWVTAANASSLPRRWHTVTYVPHRHIAIAFGGESPTPEGQEELVDALMVLDADLMLWYAPTVSGRGPAPRAGHTAVVMDQRIVLFGGCRRRKWTSDVFSLDTDMWAWERRAIAGTPPTPRVYHTATVVGHRMVVFGGNDEDRSFNDVHVLDTSAIPWRWERPCCVGDVPAPRTGHVACRVGATTLLIQGGWDPQVEDDGSSGGDGGLLAFADAFLLDTETWEWTQVPVDGGGCASWPYAAAGHACVEVGAGAVTMFGGQRKAGELRHDVVRVAAATQGDAAVGDDPTAGVKATVGEEEAVIPAAKRARRRLRGLAPEAVEGKTKAPSKALQRPLAMESRPLPLQATS